MSLAYCLLKSAPEISSTLINLQACGIKRENRVKNYSTFHPIEVARDQEDNKKLESLFMSVRCKLNRAPCDSLAPTKVW